MFRIYLGELKTGKLQRLTYLTYSILLFIIVTAILFGSIAVIGGIERLSSGDLQQVQAHLIQNYGRPAVIVFLLFSIFILFANLNLIAKRFRDMGLAGWWAVFAVVALSAVISLLFPSPDPKTPALIPGAINTMVWVFLIVIPSRAFNRDR